MKQIIAAMFFICSTACYAQTINLKLGEGSASVTAVASNVFRISASTKGPVTICKSEFLAPAIRDKGNELPIKVATGEISEQLEGGSCTVDCSTGTWSLRDRASKIIVSPSPIMRQGADAGTIEMTVACNEKATETPFGFYGAGNGDTTLLHAKVLSHVGNGVSVVPFIYSTAGFATFAVSEDDEHPMISNGVRDGTLTWQAPGTHADLYVIIAPTLDVAVSSYNKLTGLPPVPPKWAFGYLQSRWGWKDRAYIDDAAKQFTDRKMPVDAFIFDFEWYTKFADYEVKPEGVPAFSDFAFNDKLFPDPEQQIRQLHDAGIKVVGIRKPRLGNADTLVMAREKDWVTKRGPRERFESRNLKFGVSALRDWYAKMSEPLLRAGIDGWWDDEGEMTYTTYQHWNDAEIEALQAVRPNGRHWSINRAFSPGLQRTGAAAWTGDIRADWKTLERTPADLLNWSMAGMTYGGCDIGGFVPGTTPQLLTRWMEAGVFFPVMRAHSTFDATPHFPWLFGDESEAAIRRALELRYQLVPMLYSLAHAAHETGVPIMRPLAAEFPNDPDAAQISSQWMVGRLMPAPILTESNSRKVYLPQGDWYDYRTNEKMSGGNTIELKDVPFDAIPLYVHAGTILPLGAVVMHTRDCTTQPLELRVYPGADATFTLVEDDGETTDYLNGKVRRTVFTWNDAARILSWKASGDYNDKVFVIATALIATEKTAQKISLKNDGSIQFPR